MDFDIFNQKNYKNLSKEQALIVDFVKLDEQGIGLKNIILRDKVWESLNQNEKSHAIVHILKEISPYVEENEKCPSAPWGA